MFAFSISSRRLAVAVCLSIGATWPSTAAGQPTAPLPPPLELAQLPPPDRTPATGARQVRARLTVRQPPPQSAGTPGEPAMLPPTAVDVLAVNRIAGSAPIDLSPELSAFHLLLVSVDNAGAPIAWQLVLDPRRIRAEFPGADGVRSGTELVSASTDLQFVIPDDPRIVATRIYEPRWSGTAYVLHPVGVCEVAVR